MSPTRGSGRYWGTLFTQIMEAIANLEQEHSKRLSPFVFRLRAQRFDAHYTALRAGWCLTRESGSFSSVLLLIPTDHISSLYDKSPDSGLVGTATHTIRCDECYLTGLWCTSMLCASSALPDGRGSFLETFCQHPALPRHLF